MTAQKKPLVLMILDGWGYREESESNAILAANTPVLDNLWATRPRTLISGSGLDVGLPDGQMGNSEVGHVNLGAGRIVYQDLSRINKAIDNGELETNSILQEAFTKAKDTKLHFIGLVSDGGVHSHQNHLIALAKAAKAAGVENVQVHAITDGRDASPTGGYEYLSFCEDELGKIGFRINTVIGRYYAMDRDRRWDRTKLGWDAIVHGRGEFNEVLPSEAVNIQYQNLSLIHI